MWVKIDDQFFMHPKVLAAGRDARDMYLAALTYSASQLTDGIVPAGAVALIGAMAQIDDARACAAKLIEVGLWERANGGYMIHDYLDYNPPAEKVHETRRFRAEAGRRGGALSRPPMTEASEKQNGSKTEANEEAEGKLNGTPSPSPSPLYNNNPSGQLVRMVENALGSFPGERQINLWLGLLEITDDLQLIQEAIDETLRLGKRLTVAYVESILQRCVSQETRPGEWPDKQPRAAPSKPKPDLIPPGEFVHPLTGETVNGNRKKSAT